MDQLHSEYLNFIIPASFPLLWFLAVVMLRFKSKMGTEKITESEGEIIAESGWGSANINGVNFNNCLKVLEYKNGYILKTMFVFGRGKLWVPRSGYVATTAEKKLLFKSQKIKTISWGNHKVKLFGSLTERIA